jgi:hypothetical protein
MMSGVLYAVRAEGFWVWQSLELSWVVGYSPDGRDVREDIVRNRYQESASEDIEDLRVLQL